ncbi:MAG: transcriptional repressor [Pseudomonadota bacterium]
MAEPTLTEQLQTSALRSTPRRIEVCEVLEASTDRLDAQAIHQRVNLPSKPKVALSSIYRILADLERHHLIRRRERPAQPAYYEKASTRQRDHIIDRDNGTLCRIDSTGLYRLLSEAAEREGYELVDYSLCMSGVPISSHQTQGAARH